LKISSANCIWKKSSSWAFIPKRCFHHINVRCVYLRCEKVLYRLTSFISSWVLCSNHAVLRLCRLIDLFKQVVVAATLRIGSDAAFSQITLWFLVVVVAASDRGIKQCVTLLYNSQRTFYTAKICVYQRIFYGELSTFWTEPVACIRKSHCIAMWARASLFCRFTDTNAGYTEPDMKNPPQNISVNIFAVCIAYLCIDRRRMVWLRVEAMSPLLTSGTPQYLDRLNTGRRGGPPRRGSSAVLPGRAVPRPSTIAPSPPPPPSTPSRRLQLAQARHAAGAGSGHQQDMRRALEQHVGMLEAELKRKKKVATAASLAASAAGQDERNTQGGPATAQQTARPASPPSPNVGV